MKKVISLILASVMMCFFFASCQKEDEKNYTSKVTNYDSTFEEYIPEEYESDGTGTFPKVKITVKDYGEIYLTLNDEQAPITVANFVKLVKEGFYDGLTFRVATLKEQVQAVQTKQSKASFYTTVLRITFLTNAVSFQWLVPLSRIAHHRSSLSVMLILLIWTVNMPHSARLQMEWKL